MAEQQHPITPPPELVASLRNSAPHGIRDAGVTREIWLIHNAFAAGADQELEACCAWLSNHNWRSVEPALRAARRSKPPSLKERALAVIENSEICDHLSPEHAAILRRALEQLDASGNLLPHYQPLQETND